MSIPQASLLCQDQMLWNQASWLPASGQQNAQSNNSFEPHALGLHIQMTSNKNAIYFLTLKLPKLNLITQKLLNLLNLEWQPW